MKLRDKEAEARFFASDPASQSSAEIDPFEDLSDWQYDEMSTRPDMIVRDVAVHYGGLHRAAADAAALVLAISAAFDACI